MKPGTCLGPYEILSALGAGGMGEVYRARDRRLGREVALKILPDRFAGHPERKARFEREARAVSSLNHPNICTLHDIGTDAGVDYLVMELLEGESLAERLKKGALGITEALRVGAQVAEALAAAHKKGILHRDLKPGNIFLTKIGAKLLDFGLAKFEPHAEAAADQTASAPVSCDGAIVGTIQYMAPEQLEGKDVDTRADIFALGAVLYEIVTGCRAFQGSSQASLIGAIMNEDPPSITTLQPMVPAALNQLIRRCLAKRPDDRWQCPDDLAFQIRWIAEEITHPGSSPVVPPIRRSHEKWAWGLAVACLMLALAGALAYWRREPPAESRLLQFNVPLPPGTSYASSGNLLVAPDGSKIAFFTWDGAKRQLWVHSLSTAESSFVMDEPSGQLGGWWPDGKSIYYSKQAQSYRVDLATRGQQPIENREGGWLAAMDGTRTVFVVPGKGLFAGPQNGTIRQATWVSTQNGELNHLFPVPIPGGHDILFLAVQGKTPRRSVCLVSDSGMSKPLFTADSQVLYAPEGYLLYLDRNALMAQPFDASRGRLTGEPQLLIGQIATLNSGIGPFSISKNGVLVFQGGADPRSHMVWHDRAGKTLATIGKEADYSNPALSPDGSRVAVGVRDPMTRNRDIWIYDPAHDYANHFTSDHGDDFNPIWSPDGSRIYFASNRTGLRELYVKPSSGMADEVLLFASDQTKSCEDISPDERFLAFNIQGDGVTTNIWFYSLAGPKKAPFPLPHGQSLQSMARFSPDGKWIAYISSELEERQVFVQPFPPTGDKYQVSTAGGTEPQWRGDGKEMYFIAGPNLMAVPISTAGGKFEAGVPKPLFPVHLGQPFRNRYVAARDGQKFLVIDPIEYEEPARKPFTVIINWPALLKKK